MAPHMHGSHPRVLTLSPKELLVLELLRDHEPYGLQLVAASRRRLKRGTVYITLAGWRKGLHHLDARSGASRGGRIAATRLYGDRAATPHVRGLDQRHNAVGAGVRATTPPGTRLPVLAARRLDARTGRPM
jgi:hypothetical protein